MSFGDKKTFVFRTSAEFTRRYRELDAGMDAADAREDTYKRARDVDAASEAAISNARLCHEMNDLILDELERHWGPMMLDDDGTRPEFPDNWCSMFYGRMLRLEYHEREAFKGRE